MARKVTFNVRVGRMRRALQDGNNVRFLKELLSITLDANDLEDYKMSPKNIYEIIGAIQKMKNEAPKTDSAVDDWVDDAEDEASAIN